MEQEMERLLRKYPDLEVCRNDIEQAAHFLIKGYKSGKKTLLCGNGGSASDCDHIVGELMKGFTLKRPVDSLFEKELKEAFPENGEFLAQNLQQGLPAISLASHSALSTAFINDVTPEMVFAQQVYGYGEAGDMVIGISTSGNSANVVNALKVSKAMGLRTIGLTGESGGEMKEICDVTIRVPWTETLDVQERHLPIYHSLCIILEKEFFNE
ncbi:D-sedoheptulose 7-phosphate isomerase [Halobacillus dabanensis]|uniref:D-sedoheptulose 7-phosphate isomerase n=1 Tax=Halobacillus dabanensis TaxID=240302 RepID=A0A1I3S155_HALDA|nr:SIS domain-containing protein [Halobacillus dabanensis]SFJ51287.1 D-sedoheptulose 7-phosphate isomerase [Halobacillus dabanensis]